ncbi:MAG: DUF4215 domain-containing protein [Myxococcales bacterium]
MQDPNAFFQLTSKPEASESQPDFASARLTTNATCSPNSMSSATRRAPAATQKGRYRSATSVWALSAALAMTCALACGTGSNGGVLPGGGASSGGKGSGSNNGVGSSIILTSTECSGPNPPASCGKKAPPGCGDGIINQASEACDDGNAIAGDGCNGACQLEPNYVCKAEGQPCTITFSCGDGIINPGEACDQGQFQGSPGCSADCSTQDSGYKCIASQQCVPLYVCGNSRIEQGETCDPPSPGSGCDASCKTESGWRCSPGSCKRLPYCGDGIVQSDIGEKCDQGALQGSPGCSKDCLSMDATCSCQPGQACVCQAAVCGDGIVQVGEECDDKKSPYAGCSDICKVEKGYECPFAGAPCVPDCGDGILIRPAEQCDPGANVKGMDKACIKPENADATHPACTLNTGWVCEGDPPASCRQTVCGDGKVEGSEGCDPGANNNNDLGDGCTPNCNAEPSCPAAGGPCTTICGDGLVLGSEACDDGNAVSGDGCSNKCQVEAGFTCSQPAIGDKMVVPMVVRDFKAGGDFEKAAAFATGLNYANQELLEATLDSKNGLKPVLKSTKGTYDGATGKDSGIASAASFAQWYDDSATASVNTRNKTLASTLNLFLIDNSNPPTYVNRFGTNGDGLTGAQYQRTKLQFCGEVGKEDHDADGKALPCTVCYYDDDKSTPECEQKQKTVCETDSSFLECVKSANGTQWQGVFLEAAFDGNPLFFPADSLTPFSPSTTAQISGNYDPSWPATKGDHNFSFTTEVRFWFRYDSSKTYKLTFIGDDDVWVFINKRLAVDLGGIHTAVKGELTITGANATSVVSATNDENGSGDTVTTKPSLGLQNGNVYEIVVFQAERQTKASSYQLSLGGFNASPSLCKPECGGKSPELAPGEQCDSGSAGNCDESKADCYGQCTNACMLGPRCGDGEVQAEHEQCDNGTNIDGYASAGSKACSPGCKSPPYCGDGLVQIGYSEECDKGSENNDATYGGCTTECKLGPYCGDAAKNGDAAHEEECDDGVNDGTYGTCGVGCTLPPRCGDGTVQVDWSEQCEPNASDDPNCTADCRLPGYCGDAVRGDGEECDYGTAKNSGEYGGCNSNCTFAPHCGDGLTNGPEQCDAGTELNTGEYGGCTSTCQLGPHCGDATVNGSEECDYGSGPEGNGTSSSPCTSACKNYMILL